MGFFDFVFALIVFSSVMGIGAVVLSVLGITTLVKRVSRSLRAGKDPKRLEGPKLPNQAKSAPRQAAQPQPAQSAQARGGAQGRSRAQAEVPSRPRAYVYLDIDDGVTSEKVQEVMRPYVSDLVVGGYARNVLETLSAADLKKKSLFMEINDKFEKRTISWDKFTSTANAALDAILNNCILLANRVQAFDTVDYERMREFFRSGGAKRINEEEPARLQRWRLLNDSKNEMDGIQKTNEALLLELTKLGAELAKLSNSQTSAESARIAEEVSKLADETKYYK